MALSIQNNIASLVAQSNLGKSSSALNTSLQRLSSGLKINTGADGPAALVISNEQGAQIAGLQSAIDNTNQAVSLVQTGEGALAEVNDLLVQIRGLALSAANSGVNDATALAADQAQIANALNTIDSIANTTRFDNKYLLNGQAGVVASVVGNNTSSLGEIHADVNSVTGSQAVVVGASSGGAIAVPGSNMADDAAAAGSITITGGGLASAVTVDLSTTATAANTVTAIQNALNTAAGNGAFTVGGSAGAKLTITSNISGAAVNTNVVGAHGATLTGIAAGAHAGTAGAGTTGTASGGAVAGAAAMGASTLAANGTLTITGGGLSQSLVVGLSTGDNAATVVSKVQAALDNAGAIGGGSGKFSVTGGSGSQLTIKSNVLGSAVMTVQADSAGTTTLTGVSNASADSGTAGNALVVTVNGAAATVSAGTQGLNNAVSLGGTTGLSFTIGVNHGSATSGTTNLSITDNSLTFQIGANAGETSKLSFGQVGTAYLGTGVSGLNHTGTTSLSLIDVTPTDGTGAQDALKIIDQAINDVSSLRGKLGAFQTNTLQATATNLQTALTNTTSAQSVIRDTDFAAETANFTKAQVLVQAGTTVLTNANATAQLILNLLK